MSYSFKALTGGQLYPLPDFQSVSAGFDFCEVGGFEMEYPHQGVHSDKLDVDTIVIAYDDETELHNGRFYVQAGDGSHYDDVPTSKWIGKSLLDVFRRIIVHGLSSEPTKNRRFVKKNPGAIFLVGTAIMFRVQALREVGLLDERLFAYFDDNDIGTRLHA